MADASQPPLVRSQLADGVAQIILSRPAQLNAFSLEMAHEILALLRAYRDDDAVRAVVIRGDGKVFSAGGDVKVMHGFVQGEGDNGEYFHAPLTAFHEMVMAVRELPKPVLAAVHGAVAGFAWNFVLACDLVLAQQGTRFAQAFIRIGLSPDGGGTFFLPRLVGYARACELAMLPTEIDADQARDWGLVNWVVPAADFETEIGTVATRLANGPAAALGRVKALFNRGLDTGLAEHLEAERLAQIENADGPDFAEGLTAFVHKRAPRFVGVG